ncbi:unnamed protein product [Ceratitis capitata]|uniref:(Mediterranean fruit fly) hypothetical protein n=1 Tax=Ceratitis capitata TaxID=7213 RepID=A0A811U293_CERCA|nr:unnamed protein product [Ceratitis capitata]
MCVCTYWSVQLALWNLKKKQVFLVNRKFFATLRSLTGHLCASSGQTWSNGEKPPRSIVNIELSLLF